MRISMAGHAVEAVEVFKGQLRHLLDRARTTKTTITIEPPLAKSDFNDLLARISPTGPGAKVPDPKKTAQYAVIETAVRDIFNKLLVSAFTIFWSQGSS
jgi:THO complex subunit 1